MILLIRQNKEGLTSLFFYVQENLGKGGLEISLLFFLLNYHTSWCKTIIYIQEGSKEGGPRLYTLIILVVIITGYTMGFIFLIKNKSKTRSPTLYRSAKKKTRGIGYKSDGGEEFGTVKGRDRNDQGTG
ncbi:hypothetical protein Hore_21440 [Halothermothrix orenii H 168]|uniref:Uncharacterized protein n=1 Tax=Halothermothrix orenii (strain H 168 / OCM 544 / DSM 9562) TaxID=373903 RepID=B8D0F3_HALOH|nr:hypothetical protein Hore_21440 [Halothermothrix orenii H 168]